MPAAYAAPPADKGKPEQPGQQRRCAGPVRGQERREEVQAARGTNRCDHRRFQGEYGTNANKANAFGKCVSGDGEEGRGRDEAEAAEQAEENAAKKCKAERGDHRCSIAAFKAKYGTNPNKANAFGKCVSKLAKAQSTS